MPKKIIWSPDSERDLEHILDYLSSEWETSVAVRFLNIIEDLTEQISINPRQFPVIHLKLNIRKCVITKHNTLYYRNKRNHVELLRMCIIHKDFRGIRAASFEFISVCNQIRLKPARAELRLARHWW